MEGKNVFTNLMSLSSNYISGWLALAFSMWNSNVFTVTRVRDCAPVLAGNNSLVAPTPPVCKVAFAYCGGTFSQPRPLLKLSPRDPVWISLPPHSRATASTRCRHTASTTTSTHRCTHLAVSLAAALGQVVTGPVGPSR